MYKKLILMIVMVATLSVVAHEGHNDAPGSLKANHGGVVKSGKEINLEYIVSGDEVKLFPVSHEGKELTNAEVKLTITTKLPRGKSEPVKAEFKESAFIVKVEFKNSYRIEMNVVADVNGKKSIFKFQVEK